MPSGSLTHSASRTPCTHGPTYLEKLNLGKRMKFFYVNSEVFGFAQSGFLNTGDSLFRGPARFTLEAQACLALGAPGLCKGQLIQSCWIGRWAFVGCPSSSPRMRTPVNLSPPSGWDPLPRTG